LSGNATLEELPMGVENYDNLYFITAGKAANDPSESLEGSRSETLLKYLDDHFDLVIIDCSPLALVTDANYLSGFCNTTIYVVRHGYSPKFILKRLDENNAVNPLVNPVIIFSGIRNRGFTGNRNSYGYGYAYGMDHKKVKG
jgi:tyrosine-protein kinase Etk/Wzc